MADTLYTIGYSGFNINDFVAAIKQHNISVVIDVRSQPYSQYHQNYNKENIENVLNHNGVYYKNYAREFGARQEDRRLFSPEGYLDFELFAKSDNFKAGFERLKDSVQQGYIVTLMCAEKDPFECHRAIALSRVFHDNGYSISHIIPNDCVVTQEEIEVRLLNEYFPDRNQITFFENDDDCDLLPQAYRKQNAKIGYRIEEHINDDIHNGIYAKKRTAVL